MDKQKVYSELKGRLEASGAAQNKIAAATGVPQPSISRFLASKTGLSADSFLELLAYVDGEVIFYKETTAEDGPCVQEREALRKENAMLRDQITALKSANEVLREVAGLPSKHSLSAGERSYPY